ncbi:MAG: CRISPR system precrRNA processing endoribonuclease RAMP protein Cas6 [Thermodesulfobacteriota bacterium]
MNRLDTITFSLYRLSLEAIDRIELPRLNKGITLRGAFGTVFRRLVCHDLKADCTTCPLHGSCPYGFIFTPKVPENAVRLRLNQDIPRPFVIKPPLDQGDTYERGEILSFDLVVVGKAQDFLPYFVVTFEELGRQGIGVRRGRFRMLRLESLNGDGSWAEVFDYRDRMVKPAGTSISPGELLRSGDEKASALKVRFLTPVLLKEGGRWAKPGFGTLAKRLRDRVNALSTFYGSGPLEMDFREFGRKADAVETVAERLRWVEENRYSAHRDLKHVLKGYVGEAEFAGEMAQFMPLMRLGEILHVGKATAFGQGWFQMTVGSME